MPVITHDQAIGLISYRYRPRATAGAQTINRAAMVLRILSTYGNLGASLMEVCRASGLHKATAHRMLAALTLERLVERVSSSRNYRLGPDVFAFGAAIGERFDFKTLARPALERIALETADIVYLAIQSGYDGLCIDSCEGSFEKKSLRLRILDRWPLGIGAFSMAILAYLRDDEVAEIIKYNRARLAGQPLYSPERLWTMVTETRARGYALNEVRTFPGMTGVGVPILSQKRRPLASLCVAAINERMTGRRREQIAASLIEESRNVAKLYHSTNKFDEHSESWKFVGKSGLEVQEAK